MPEANRITVRQLLAHRSGVPHLNDLAGYDEVMRGAVSLDGGGVIAPALADSMLGAGPGRHLSGRAPG